METVFRINVKKVHRGADFKGGRSAMSEKIELILILFIFNKLTLLD